MTLHISTRIAWHNDGWNGHICHNPKANTYCIGQYSYPGEHIRENQDIEWEQKMAGMPCHKLDKMPPCIYSINAFGAHTLPGVTAPPAWFRDDTQIKRWQLPPYGVAIWPFEEMYKEEVENPPSQRPPKYDPAKRRQAANGFFSEISPGRSLIFYYANYSNPFSENDQRVYVIVGIGRIKNVGEELTWDGQSEEMERRYGPNVWARAITSHYPDQGFLLPYHLYKDQPDVLERILFSPPNPRHFKYATRHISDDGALELIERAAEIVGILQDIGDNNENWAVRQAWLSSVMAELWQHRGIYPGILKVWNFLRFHEAIHYTMVQAPQKGEDVVKTELFDLVQGKINSIPGLSLTPKRIKDIRKSWRYLVPDEQVLLRDVLPRFDLQETDRIKQITNIIKRQAQVSITATHAEIAENPYSLSEQYIGEDPDDQITFSQIDHGMFPSPDLGVEYDLEPDNWPRLRALCVQQLQHASQHTFLPADQIIHDINHKLSFLPEWKRAQFTQRYLEVEKDDLSKALTYRQQDGELYLYLKQVFEDERLVEKTLRQLANRPDIRLRFPVTEGHWKTFLTDPKSEMAQKFPAEYEEAIMQQVQVCQDIFLHPISVLFGGAGTGKTTVVTALIQAIKKGHGTGTSFQLLAPTGKAADRLRERTGKDARTIHSFLAQRGWLNDNMTFRRGGGRKEEGFTTYIIDESSMLDLPLLATFSRAVNWNSVQRLIFVGDPNQLPPIGTGKVYADLIDWLKQELPDYVGELTINMRQKINELTDKGTGIIDLASIYTRRSLETQKSADVEAHEEIVLSQVQEGGDISDDLRVLYWQNPDELEQLLIESIVADMERDTGRKFNEEKPYTLWDAALKRDGQPYPEALQIISPYRGELFGIEHINFILQRHKNGWWLDNKGSLGGITYFDKVIQVLNRPKSNPIWAYNNQTRNTEKIEVFNGEIGMSKIHGFDAKKWKWNRFRLQKFQVIFSRKQHQWVNYSSENEVEENLELAYAISVHKSQGSEFLRVYFILPKHNRGLLSRELFYTGITRAQTHCTLLIEEDIAPILSLRRLENSHLIRINSSLFQFRPVPPEFQSMGTWYEEGKIHRTLTNYMVRSKSEVIIANILFDRDIPFEYEIPLYAPDGTFYLPDFTITMQGEKWYWEHLGMLHQKRYRNHWETKKAWYEKHGFSDRLIITSEEEGFDSQKVLQILQEKFRIT